MRYSFKLTPENTDKTYVKHRLQYVYSILLLVGLVAYSATAFAINGRTTYQAKIYKPDGQPLESVSVNFRFTVLDPSSSCVLFVEDYAAVNMIGSGGLTSFSLGMGTRTYPASGPTTFAGVFDNSTPSFVCQTPGVYNPIPTDNRKVVMQFNEGSGWQTLPAMAINSVPYAMYSAKAQNSSLLNGKADSAFVEVSTLAGLSCQANEAIKFNGATFSCIAVGVSSSGISSVTTSGTVLSTGGTASAPVISITAATMSSDGYLTSLDYAEFKAKLSASATQIVSVLGYAPVSSSAVSTQIQAANLAGDVSGTIASNFIQSVGGKTSAQVATSVDDTIAATSSSTANTIVKRNASGNFTANDVYANAAKLNYVDIYKPSTSFNIRLQAPTSLAANYTLNLPTSSGTVGQVLSTDGSGNLSWISAATGSVTSVSATAPLVSTGGATPTISITQATSATDGYLSSADWNTFNNKQQATQAAIIATLGYTPANATSATQWTTSGTHISYSTGNVGIGTTTPGFPLDVSGSVRTGTISNGSVVMGNDGNAFIEMRENDSAGTPYVDFVNDPGTDFDFRFILNGDDSFSLMGGSVGIGTQTPTALLNLAAGSVSNAPLKFTSGTLLSSPQSGTMEYDGNQYYLTDSANIRRTIATGSAAGSIDNASTINSTGNITMVPVGSVIVSSTTVSTNSQTGALIVTGGLGIAGNIYSSGTIITSSNMQGASITATNGLITPYVYGSTASGGSLSLESTTHANKGNILLANGGGNIGIGTTAPGSKLEIRSNTDARLTLNRIGGWATSPADIKFNTNDAGTDAWTFGMAADSTNNMRLKYNTNEFLTVLTNGNVGVGTTAPGLMLETSGVNGFPATSGTTQTGSFRVGNSGSQRVLDFGIDGAASTAWLQSTTRTNLANGNSLVLNPNGGNVGIGTSSPVYSLDVTGGIRSTRNIHQLDTAGNGFIMTNRPDNSLDYWQLSPVAAGTPDYTKGIALVRSTGNVGIGLTNPSATLDVQNNSATSGSVTAKLLQPNHPTGTSSYLKIGRDVSTTYNAADIAFSYSGSGSNQNRLDFGFQGIAPIVAIRADGNVGIGTNAPTQKLDVVGSIKATNYVVANSTYSQAVNAGDNWIRIASGSGNSYADLRISGATSSQHAFMRLLVSCNFPDGSRGDNCDIAIPQKSEHSITNFKSVRVVKLSTYDTYYVEVLLGNNSGATTDINVEAKDLSGFTILDPPVAGSIPASYSAQTVSAALSLASFGNGAFNIENTGNVGIGTTSPAAKLHLNGSDSRGITLSPGTTSQRIDFLHNDNGNVNAIYANIAGVLEDGSAGRNYGHLVLATAPSTAGNPATVERVRITGNGNVGIGTSAPGEKLDVLGNMRVGSSDSNYIAFRGTTGDGAGSYNHTYIGERFYAAGESSELLLFKGNDSDNASGPDRIRMAAGNIVFDTYTSPDAPSGTFEAVASSPMITTKMIIKGNGNVGVGLEVPTSKLHVNGGIKQPNHGQLVSMWDGTTRTTTMPAFLTSAYIEDHQDETFTWRGIAPRFKDTAGCNSGPTPNYFFDGFDTTWNGVYRMTLGKLSGVTYLAEIEWKGWGVTLRDAAGAAIATSSSQGTVQATLAWDGSVWMVQHMQGQVGTTIFSCH